MFFQVLLHGPTVLDFGLEGPSEFQTSEAGSSYDEFKRFEYSSIAYLFEYLKEDMYLEGECTAAEKPCAAHVMPEVCSVASKQLGEALGKHKDPANCHCLAQICTRYYLCSPFTAQKLDVFYPMKITVWWVAWDYSPPTFHSWTLTSYRGLQVRQKFQNAHHFCRLLLTCLQTQLH